MMFLPSVTIKCEVIADVMLQRSGDNHIADTKRNWRRKCRIHTAMQTYTSATAMKNHTHTHQTQITAEPFEPANPERFAAAQKSTWVSIAINVLLTFFQIVGGFFAHSQALMADGLHSLSDLLSDVLVLYANRHGNRHADANHPYGHARVETAATLILGTFLAVLGVILLIAAAMKLQHPEALHTVNPLAL
ncbi:MAG: cation diffusion facilitator family transporter, partial [Gallionella sp.]|nr:cation diffusion facilitator family transporter [Gallionella sp.]